jgi:hypothetical protein
VIRAAEALHQSPDIFLAALLRTPVRTTKVAKAWKLARFFLQPHQLLAATHSVIQDVGFDLFAKSALWQADHSQRVRDCGWIPVAPLDHYALPPSPGWALRTGFSPLEIKAGKLKQYLELMRRLQFFAEDVAILHYEGWMGEDGDVGERVASDGDDVGVEAGLELADGVGPAQ